jgi:hypothetical protein
VLIYVNDVRHLEAGVGSRAAQDRQAVRFTQQMIRVATPIFLDEIQVPSNRLSTLSP